MLALHVIRVPLDQALDVELIDADEQAQASLAEAKLLAAEQGIPIDVEIVRSRSIGQTAVHEAREHDRRFDRDGLGTSLATTVPVLQPDGRFPAPQGSAR